MKPLFFILLLLLLLLSSASHNHASNQWNKFLNLTGCRLGDTNPLLSDLKKHLNHLGYLPPPPHNAFTDSFDAALLSALSAYRSTFHLKPTAGVLDARTLYHLITPRCSLPDLTPLNATWPPSKRTLTWAIVTRYPTLNAYVLRETFRHALSRWEGVSDFRFFQVCPTESPDITIGFFTGDGDGRSDGPMGTFGRAFGPEDGRVELDGGENWTDDLERALSDESFDLESVVVHEIGHVLGLGHSSDPDSIMFPMLRPLTRKVEITVDDKKRIQFLYDEFGFGPAIDEPNLHVAV